MTRQHVALRLTVTLRATVLLLSFAIVPFSLAGDKDLMQRGGPGAGPAACNIPAPKPNRVLADEPLQPRMIIPGAVVVQACAILLTPGVFERVG